MPATLDAPATASTAGSAGPRGDATLRPALILIGFTATIAQIVLMRELVVVFYGNEICFGLILVTQSRARTFVIASSA